MDNHDKNTNVLSVADVVAIKIFIIHVSTNKERYEHMEHMLGKCNLPYEHEYINVGDMGDITEDILDKYYINKDDSQMHLVAPHVSCSYKHILAYHKIIEENLGGALILEDDIFLHDNFASVFERSILEFKDKHSKEPALISYEDSALLFVPRSKRKKGQYLYKGNHDRYTGAYFVNAIFAKKVLEDLRKNKTHLPIDGYHNYLSQEGIINYLWCHPAIATQGSCNGTIKTLISSNLYIGLPYERIKWFFKINYRKLMYYFR